MNKELENPFWEGPVDDELIGEMEDRAYRALISRYWNK